MKLLPLTFLGFILVNEGFGFRGYGDQCTHYSNGPENCDPRKMLECDRQNRCKCVDNLVWIYQYDRCGLRVGSPCPPGNFGGGNFGQGLIPQGGGIGAISSYPSCPPNSYCDTQAHTCVCEPYYRPNYDYSACNGTRGKANFSYLTSLFLLITFAKFI